MKKHRGEAPARNKALVVVGCAALLAFACGLTACKSHEEPYTVEVVEKIYQPHKTSTGVGYGFSGGKGGGGPIIVSSSQAEKWILIVRDGEDVHSQEVDAQTWAASKPGDHLTFTRTVWE